MPLLSQVIGHAQDGKKRALALLTDTKHRLEKPSMYTGLTKTYTPLIEEGQQYPPEVSVVQTTVIKELLSVVGDKYQGYLSDYIDQSLTLNQGNAQVLVDVSLDGGVLFSQVPPTFLMEMKGLLVHLNTVVSKLPTLDAAIQWEFNKNSGLWESLPTTTFKTNKTKQVMQAAPPTDKHPEQFIVLDVDINVGTWKKVDLSGAIPLPERNKLMDRVQTLQRAIDDALALANATKVEAHNGGVRLVQYIFHDVLS